VHIYGIDLDDSTKSTLLTNSPMSFTLPSEEITNVFDRTSGTNVYFGGLNDANWIGTMFGVTPNAGSEFLASAIATSSPDVQGLGLNKELGGVIENRAYAVSFFVTKYLDAAV